MHMLAHPTVAADQLLTQLHFSLVTPLFVSGTGGGWLVSSLGDNRWRTQEMVMNIQSCGITSRWVKRSLCEDSVVMWSMPLEADFKNIPWCLAKGGGGGIVPHLLKIWVHIASWSLGWDLSAHISSQSFFSGAFAVPLLSLISNWLVIDWSQVVKLCFESAFI